MRNSPLRAFANNDKPKKKPVPKPEGGFMNPPYRYPAGPTEKAKGYHGYKKPMHKMPDGTMMEGATHKKVMKDGTKNKTHGAGNTGNWQANQFKAKKSTTSAHGQLNDAEAEYKNDIKSSKRK